MTVTLAIGFGKIPDRPSIIYYDLIERYFYADASKIARKNLREKD